MQVVQYHYRTPPHWWFLGFPTIQNAINETAQATQAPIKMVAHCAINATFAVSQALADFERPDGGTSPISNISLIIGDTGERKSSVDACFFAELLSFRKQLSDAAARADLDYDIQMRMWKIEADAFNGRLRKALTGDRLDLDMVKEELKAHQMRRPTRPHKSSFLYKDSSLTSLKLGLAGFPAACVHSTEGMSLLKGALFEDQDFLCTLYSGEPHPFDRYRESVMLTDCRLCVSAHSQTKRTIAFLAKMGDDYRDSGLAARMTICLVREWESKIGDRQHDAVKIPTTYRDIFRERIRYLLMEALRAAGRPHFKRRKIRLSPAAQREYLEYANWIEREMRPGGNFHFARDYANRLVDKIGRLSSDIHLFEDLEGDISVETFLAARSFYEEVTDDFLYLFNYLPSNDFMADRLRTWLKTMRPPAGQVAWKKTQIQQYCFAELRKKAALDPALHMLEQQGEIHFRSSNGTTYVHQGPYTPDNRLSSPRNLDI